MLGGMFPRGGRGITNTQANKHCITTPVWLAVVNGTIMQVIAHDAALHTCGKHTPGAFKRYR